MTLSREITDLYKIWNALKLIPSALKGEDLDALREMPHEELVLLAWRALNCVEAVDSYAYLISSLEGHLDGPGAHYEGWCVAQADGGDNQGGFNKWPKVSGGYAQEGGPYGDFLICENWKDAKAILDSKEPDIRQHFRIYPVVMSAGNEPRTTKPPKEHQC